MKIQIQVSDDKIDHFSSEAKKELKKQSGRITNEIVDEACRIEATRHIPDTASEITQSIVNEAATQPQMKFGKKKTRRYQITQVSAGISSLLSGLLLDFDNMATNLIVFIISLVLLAIALVTHTCLILKYE